MLRKVIFYLLCTILLSLEVKAQNGINIIEGPLHILHCDSNCFTIHANYPKPLKTNQYQTSSIPYQTITSAGTSVSVNDEKFSSAIPIGFNFCFFEQLYTNCFISDNGILTFNNSFAGGNCNNNTQQTLPYFNSTFPDNAIFGLFMDINPSLGGSIKYITTGIAPNRSLQITYENVRLFGLTCSAATSTFQIVLRETTNIIDVFIKNKVTCDATPSNYANYATVGIQNSGATQAYTAAGKHASIFVSNNEGIRFSPSGPIDYQMVWKNALNNVLATNVDSIYFCAPYIPYHKIKAEIIYNCPPGVFSDTVSITKNLPSFDSILIQKPLCNGDSSGIVSIFTSGPTGPYTFSISNGPFSSNSVFSGLAPNNILFSIKDANGCRRDTFINLLPQYIVLVAVDSIKKPACPHDNGVAIVHGVNGTAPYTYVWSNGDTGPMADSLSAGTHLVTITDSNGCVGHRFINLVNDSIPIVQYFMTKPMCGDSSGSIALTVTNGHPGYHFSWSNGDTTSTANNLHAGLYTVTVSDNIGCQTSSIFVVSDTLTTITQDTVIANTTCNTANGILQVTGLQGLPPYTYQWLPGGQTTSLVSNLAAGTYICITKDANNCAKIDTLVVNPSLGLENIVTKANANCDSSNGKIYLNGVLHHTGSYQILWSTGATSSSIVGLSPGAYWVKTTDSIGCTKTDTITLLNDGIPHLKLISYTAPQCFGDSNGSVTLGGQGGGPPYKYSLDSTNFSSVAQMNNISGGTFTIYITDANACPNDTIVFFPQPPEIIVSYQADTVICFNDQTAAIEFAVTGGYPPYLLSWNGNSFTNQFAFTNQTQGIYPVIIKDSNNCTISKNVIIPGPQQPLEIVTEIKDIPCFETNNGSIHITLQGGWQPYTYSWSNGAQGLVLDSLGVTNAQFTVTDSIGCVVQKNITVEQLLCCKAVLPNAFSPNGDTKNDVLRILPISEVSTVKWIIYNRWGQVVFSTKNITDAWDGNYNGAKCDLGVYYYLLEYTCPFQKEKMILKGDITLVR